MVPSELRVRAFERRISVRLGLFDALIVEKISQPAERGAHSSID